MMADWNVHVTANDVGSSLRNLLEDWEDGLAKAVDEVTESEVQRLSVPQAVRDMTRAVGLINTSKSAVTTFIPKATTLLASPHVAIPLTVFGEVSGLMQKASDAEARIAVLKQEYAEVRSNLMKQIRKAEHTFPSTDAGRSIAQQVQRVCQGLVYKDATARDSWMLRFLEHLGAIELDQRKLTQQIKEGFHPIFEKLGWIISEGLRDTRSGFGRLFGTDPKFVWNGFHIHVPGSHKKSSGAVWPGSEPSPGLRRATSDEIKKIVMEVWKHKVTRRSLLVGTGYVANTVYIVEVRPNLQGILEKPDVKPSIEAMFEKRNVANALEKARNDVGPDQVALSNAPSP
jgi:hypothetical protein